uniref:Triokinase/FMN cyclase n=1 Tax=Plectus sambesii TaxID=2011161 RepID=A0A914XEJ4_9BILA
MADSCDHTLDSITATMGKVCENVGTIGVSLSSCSLPGRSAMFALGEEEIELGLGVHGEPGVRRVSIKSAKEVVDMMLKHMTLKDSASSINFSKEDSVAVLVNNLGGLSQLEMNIVCGEVLDWLSAAGVQVQRFYSGACMTSLEMRGVSISVLKLQSDWLRYLDAPTEATAWPAPSFPQPSEPFRMPSVQKNAPHENPDCDFERDALEIDQEAAKRFENCVRAACKALIEAEDELNELDSAAGDGDCGQTLRRSAQAIISAIERSDVPFSRPAVALHRLSSVVEEGTGGTTGGIYAILMSAAADVLVKDVSTDGWVAALSGGLEAVMKYGRAEPGDRTMVDPVHAALTVLQEAKSVDEATWSSAVEAAEKSARETATMKAKAGRASYTAQEHQTHPDPGAIAAARWLRAVLNSCRPAERVKASNWNGKETRTAVDGTASGAVVTAEDGITERDGAPPGESPSPSHRRLPPTLSRRRRVSSLVISPLAVMRFDSLLLFVCFSVVAVSLSFQANSTNIESEEAIQRVLDDKLSAKNYDKRIRPKSETDGPTSVAIDIYIRSISSVDELAMEFKTDILVRQHWHDPRLQYESKTGSVYVAGSQPEVVEKIWKPDLFFANERSGHFHAITVPNTLLRFYSDGQILWSNRYSLTISCDMDLKKYPFDTQKCIMQMGSFSFTDASLVFSWFGDSPISINSDIRLAKFYLHGIERLPCSNPHYTGNFSCLRMQYVFTRQLGYHFAQSFLPSMLLVFASWLSFWLDIDAIPARVTLGVTSLLTTIAQGNHIKSSLPPVSYIKAIDIWEGVCVFYVFMALVEFAFANYLARMDTRAAIKRNRRTQKQQAKGYPHNRRTKDSKATLIDDEDDMAPLAVIGSNGSISAVKPRKNGKLARELRMDGTQSEVVETAAPISREEYLHNVMDCRSFDLIDKPSAHRVDKISRFLFPITYFCFVAVYTVWYGVLFEAYTAVDMLF